MSNSYIRKVGRRGMREKKFYTARTQEERRYVVSRNRRSFDMEIVVDDSKRCRIAGMRKSLETTK